jgi:4-hydroxyphenylpyruvate dioxygenase
VPSTYYDTLLDRVGHIDEELNALKQLGILVDRDDEVICSRFLSKRWQDRPTLFFEIIQRKGAEELWQRQFQSVVSKRLNASKAARGKFIAMIEYHSYRVKLPAAYKDVRQVGLAS